MGVVVLHDDLQLFQKMAVQAQYLMNIAEECLEEVLILDEDGGWLPDLGDNILQILTVGPLGLYEFLDSEYLLAVLLQ